MDTTAHRIIKQARDILTDGLHDWPERGLTVDQADELARIDSALADLLTNDPAPPACPTCCTPLIQPTTGRPKTFCSDACRQQQARVDAHLRSDPWSS
jgi:hypothetical protein